MIELYHNDMSVCAQKFDSRSRRKSWPWEGHHLNLRAGDQAEARIFEKLSSNRVSQEHSAL